MKHSKQTYQANKKDSLGNFSLNSQVLAAPLKECVIDWGLRLLGLASCWQKSRGEGIKVAVLDTGVDVKHTDLKGAIKATQDFTNSSTSVQDEHGHGTHVAGIIGARASQIGVIGVAPAVELYCAKVVQDEGFGTADSLTKGIYWAIEQQVDIITISLSTKEPNTALEKAIKAASQAGIYLFAAAGNRGGLEQGIYYPARYEEVITVGAVDQVLRVADFSSQGKEVDVVAPGADILSTHPTTNNNGQLIQHARWSGTSMAAPFVAGLVALVLAYYKKQQLPPPFKDYQELREFLRHASVDLGAIGQDLDSGWGLLDPLLLF